MAAGCWVSRSRAERSSFTNGYTSTNTNTIHKSNSHNPNIGPISSPRSETHSVGKSTQKGSESEKI